MKTHLDIPLLQSAQDTKNVMEGDQDTPEALDAQLLRELSFSVQDEDVPVRVREYLEQLGLSVADLRQAHIDPLAFYQLIRKSCSGHLIRWLALDDLFTKMLLFPWLDERGIVQKKITPSQPGRCFALGEHVTSRVWPRALLVPFRSPTILKRLHGAQAFTQGSATVVTHLWSVVLFSFLGVDLYRYFSESDHPGKTTFARVLEGQLNKEQSLITYLTNPNNPLSRYYLAGLVGLPLAFGLYKSLKERYLVGAYTDQRLNQLIQQLNAYQPSFRQDLLVWATPINAVDDLLDSVRYALASDNRYTAEERLALIAAFVAFTQRTQKQTQLMALSAWATIADGVALRDLARLARLGVDPLLIGSFLAAKTHALQTLQQAAIYRPLASHGCLDRRIKPLLRYLAAQYFLWGLGQGKTA